MKIKYLVEDFKEDYEETIVSVLKHLYDELGYNEDICIQYSENKEIIDLIASVCNKYDTHIRNAISKHLSTLPIDPNQFENVVDNYFDLMVDAGYKSVEDWWNDFNDSDEINHLRDMGYLKEDLNEYTENRYDFIVKRYDNPSEEHEVIVAKSYDDACNKLNNDEYVEWYDDWK